MEEFLFWVCFGIVDNGSLSGNATCCSFSAELKVGADQCLDIWSTTGCHWSWWFLKPNWESSANHLKSWWATEPSINEFLS